jgi:hypothetical protein
MIVIEHTSFVDRIDFWADWYALTGVWPIPSRSAFLRRQAD